MSSIIELLPDHVANQIAAGEVVQRPASVVKELLENAVDAKATDIKLIIKDAGKTLIQVIDNGLGMSVTDARLCFARHATSKIKKAEDLFALHTKGFRGEALASIAAIAHVELKTKQAQEELGTHLIIEGSKFVSQEVAVLPNGTSFAIKNLFFNIPARRNFLKSDNVEFRHVLDEFQRVAMAHPDIQFSMIHNGSEFYQLPAASLRQRIVGIFSGKTNEKLVPISEETDIIQIHGFIGKPEFAKKSKSEQFFFVNDRFIKSGYLHHAVMSAYEGLLKDGMQPSYFIYLHLPPESIDINIHPTKTEIKFDDEQVLYAILRSSIKHSLGQFNVAPVLDFERDSSLDTPYHFSQKEAVTPTIAINPNFNPFENAPFETSKPSSSNSGENSFNPFENQSFETSKPSSSNGGGSSFKPNFGNFKQPAAPSWESLYTNIQKDTQEIQAITFESEHNDVPLFSENEIEKSTKKTYQLHKKYIVSTIKSGMVIIDQQRAHQRVLYERFFENISNQKASSQQLLFPLNLFYSTTELQLLREAFPALIQSGFIFDTSHNEHLVVTGIPVNVSESEVSTLLEQLINDLQEGLPEAGFNYADKISKSLAKSLASKTGTLLNEKEQENLINSLFACREPQVSPFEKTTFITLTIEDIEKKFN